MKKVVGVMLALFFLTGCGSEAVWETVRDVQPMGEVPCWQEAAYTITVGQPERSDLQVETRTLLTSSLESAVRQLTGRELGSLTILQTTRFDLPEYQFAWYQEDTGQLCRADLVLDDPICYAVLCSAPVSAGSLWEQEARQVFSSFGLHQNEDV